MIILMSILIKLDTNDFKIIRVIFFIGFIFFKILLFNSQVIYKAFKLIKTFKYFNRVHSRLKLDNCHFLDYFSYNCKCFCGDQVIFNFKEIVLDFCNILVFFYKFLNRIKFRKVLEKPLFLELFNGDLLIKKKFIKNYSKTPDISTWFYFVIFN